MRAVIVRYDPMRGLIGELATVTRSGVHVVENEGDVLVITRVPATHQEKPNVFHGTSVKGATVVLVDEEHFPIIFPFKHIIETP